MSEIAASTTVTESAPTSTAEAASQVIDSFESGGDDGIEVSGETPTVTETTTETPAADTTEPAKELSAEEREAEALLAEFGYKDARKPDGREHWMPRSKALKMIANGLRKGRDRWTGEKTQIETRATELQGYIDNLAKGVSGDPVAFLSELAGIDARYKRFIEQQARAAQETPKAEDDPEPEPDYPLPDGSRTYSLDGIKKREAWLRRQVQREIDAKLKPFAEREQQEKARQAQETQMATLREKTTKQMTEAQTWPLFGQLPADGSLTPFQQEVLGALQADKTLDLRGAYMKVAMPRLMEDDAKKRERLLKEINAAPKSTAITKGGAEIQRQTGPTTTADIAARAYERLERGR